MKRQGLFAVASFATVFALLAACGTDDVTTVVVCADAGADSSVSDAAEDVTVQVEASVHEAGPVEAGPDYAPVTTTQRKLGALDSYWLVGVTSGPTPDAIYYTQTTTSYALKAIPVAGGDEVVLSPDLNPFFINDVKALVVGGAVAWADTGDSNDIAPALHVWTHAGGVKTITTNTLLTQFWATADGATIAFSANAVAGKSSDIVVTSSVNPDLTTPVITGLNAENIAVNTASCATKFGFAGTTFVAAYCTGTTTAATQQQLVTVDATVAPLAAVVRVGNTNPADAFDGAWLSDAQGKNFFVKNSALSGRVIATAGVTTTVGTIATVQADVNVAPDGSVVLYRDASSTLFKATFAATPVVTSVGTNIGQLLRVTPDSKLALVSSNTIALASGDLSAIDITSATANPAPVALVVTDTALLDGITGDGKRAVYFEGNPDGTLSLSTVALTGGDPVLLNASSNNVVLAQTGTGVLSLFDETPVLHSDSATHISLSYSDGARGGLLEKPYATILDAQDIFTVTGKTFVYRDVGTNVGIYAIDMP